MGRGSTRHGFALALVAAAWLALAPAAGAHEVGAGGPKNVRADPDEAAAIGQEHALAHARARALERRAHRRWQRLSPAQRAQRLAAAKRAEQHSSRQLGARGRDDVGYWGDQRGLLFALPDSAIHTVLMPTGEFMIFGREPLQPDGTTINLGSAAIFNPATGRSRSVDPPPIPENGGLPAAIYCGGMALLSDGRVLVVGGNLSGVGGIAGLKYTFLFDPWKETWEIGPQMTAGRWYPTLARLPSGDIIIYSGLDHTGGGVAKNPQMDLFRPGIDDSAAALVPFPAGYREYNPAAAPDSRFGQSLYPMMFTLPDGNVVLAGPGNADSAVLRTSIALDRTKPLGSAWKQFATRPTEHYGGTAVIEPQMGSYSGSWRVLLAGGKLGLPAPQPARRVVERLDATPGGNPSWQAVDAKEQLSTARYWPNNVLLPDGGMVVVGGGSGVQPNGPVEYWVKTPAPQQLRQVELRRPGEKRWRLGAAQLEWRTYHSTASLMPDGRIFSGGDDYHEGPDPLHPLPADVRRDSAEFYWPPYLFDGNSCAPRPVIRAVGATTPGAPKAAWATVGYGETFGIFGEHARSGMQAALVAPSAVTHAMDMNQRVVALQVTSRVAGGGINAKAPATAGIAPPGWYMLFVVDADGTPSVARWVRVLPTSQAIVARGGRALSTVTGLWAATPQLRTCANPDGSTRTEQTKLTSKLTVSRMTIARGSRRLQLRGRIGSSASGKLRIELGAGRRRIALDTRIRRGGVIKVRRRISRSLARPGTGLVRVSYAGDADTRARATRLRAARRAARLRLKRPTLTAGGRIRASGTITRRARGVVRVELEYVVAGETVTVQLRAKIAKGRWTLSRQLSPAVRDQIAHRTGTLHSYASFTGYKRAGVRGEMRSFEVLGDL